MGIEENPIDRDVTDILPNNRLKQVIDTQKPVLDRDVRINGLELVFNEVPIHLKKGNIVGAIATRSPFYETGASLPRWRA